MVEIWKKLWEGGIKPPVALPCKYVRSGCLITPCQTGCNPRHITLYFILFRALRGQGVGHVKFKNH